MPKHNKKNTIIFKAARENTSKASESITKTPTWKHLLIFAFPTILSMIIMGTFGIVDGIFVSRLIDPIALAPVSVIFPFLSFSMAIGLLLGVGGNAMIAKKLGEGRDKEGRQNFSLIVLVGFIASIAVMAIGLLFPDFILDILGTDDFLRGMAMDYLQPLLWFMPTTVLGMVFQQFLITVGKAHYGAITALIGGGISAGLNFVFIRLLDMGIMGAVQKPTHMSVWAFANLLLRFVIYFEIHLKYRREFNATIADATTETNTTIQGKESKRSNNIPKIN